MRPLLPEAPVSIFPLFFTQVFMLLLLFLALLFDVIELTFFSLIILTMSFGSNLWSRISLNNVKCSIELNRVRLFPGDKLKIEIRAINSKLLPVRFGVDLFIPRTISGTDKGQWIDEETGLLWFQQFVFFRDLRPNKRGVYDLGPPRLRGGDLFGFFQMDLRGIAIGFVTNAHIHGGRPKIIPISRSPMQM